MPKKRLTDEQCQDIILNAEAVAATLIAQFSISPPEVCTSLQLGMMKAIAVLWASQTGADPNAIFDKFIAAIPETLKANYEGIVH